MKRRKPKAARKEERILIRVTAEQKAKLTAAATRWGLGLSTWMVVVGLREAESGRGPGTAS